MKKINDVILEQLSKYTADNDPIDPSLYEKYRVMRGLRYPDGRGVVVGLTKIGDVVGYNVDDAGGKIAVPGRLLYRGYDVEAIVRDAQKSHQFGFEQCAYLLLLGELPSKEQLASFNKYLGSLRKMPKYFTEDMIMRAPSSDIMNKLARGVLALYSYDPEPENRSVENVIRQCIELTARLHMLAAYSYQAKRRYFEEKSMYVHIPLPELSTAENFLRLIRHDKKYTQLEAEVLDLCLILHAEHGGGNNSSFAIHVVSSADTDTYSAVAAAIGSLKGRRHGGANIRVSEMMDDIKKNVKDWADEDEVKAYLTKIAHKKAFDRTGLIYGQGHAVYTISDPRALLLREKAGELAKEKGCEDEFFLYKTIEKLAPEILYEIHGTKKLICTNVDFYSGFVYSMLGIPRDLFTPLFAVSRIAGWSAHRVEEIVVGKRIYRPAYKSVSQERSYVPFAERGEGSAVSAGE